MVCYGKSGLVWHIDVVNDAYYHITVLSNFARGYDKYARRYSKINIPESRFPNQFYLLCIDELSIGIEKASRLLNKLALAGNSLIALETHLPAAELRPNRESGLGQFVESPAIRLDGLQEVAITNDGWQLTPLLTEEAMARALRLLHCELLPYSELKPRTFSILPIAQGCQAACPFCFSDASVSAIQEQARLNSNHVCEAARIARAHGAERFVITGGGEPGLVPHPRLLQLIEAGSKELGRSTLITNGHHLAMLDGSARRQRLFDYRSVGLNVLAVSRHHFDDDVNERLMNLAAPIIDLAKDAASCPAGMRLRLTCVLQQGGIDDLASIEQYVAWAASLGVEEICFKELYVSTSVESIYHAFSANQWSRTHQVPLSLVLDFADHHGFLEIARLPWGAPVFHGAWSGRCMRICAYTEPSLFWERTHGIARSWNMMADGRCLASLEDRNSDLLLEEQIV